MKFLNLENTQYGTKAVCINDKGEQKKYAMSPIAMTKSASFMNGQVVYAKWGKDARGFPIIEDWSDTPTKKPYSGSSGGSSGGYSGKSFQYDNRTFVSNVVGSAIEAKLITDPSHIHIWAREAWKAISGLNEKPSGAANAQQPVTHPANVQVPVTSYDDFNDDIPGFD